MIRFLLYLPVSLLSAHVPIILVNKTLNWSSAQDFCRQYYTDLAAIESLEADDVLGDLSNTSAWVGLYWDCAENWQWSDGQKINYTAWDEMVCCSLRLPTTAKCTDQRFNFCRDNNFNVSLPICLHTQFFCNNSICPTCLIDFMVEGIGSCGLDKIIGPICVSTSNNGWVESNCEKQLPFICRGHNFTLNNVLANWTEALKSCRAQGKDLATVKNQAEQEEIKGLMDRFHEQAAWIGLFHSPWRWSNNRSLNGKISFPNNVTKNKGSTKAMCAIILNRTTMETLRCEVSKPFYCYFESSQPMTPEKLNWEKAMNKCTLVYIDSDQDQMKTWSRARSGNSSTEWVWIGLRQSQLFGFWWWAGPYYHNELKLLVYKNWMDDIEPSLPRSYPCGALNKVTGKWKDMNCKTELSYLCSEK